MTTAKPIAPRPCHTCGEPLDLRKRKFCSRSCARSAHQDSGSRLCEVEGCERSHRARGFCSMHYRREFGPAPSDRPREFECGVCGKVAVRSGARSPSRVPTCSYACRSLLQSPPRTDLPEWHPARGGAWAYPVEFTACAHCDRPIQTVLNMNPSAPKRKFCSKRCSERRPPSRFIAGRCPCCGDAFILDRQRNHSLGGGGRLFCSARCLARLSRAEDSHIRRALEGASTEKGLTWRKVVERDGFECALCGEQTDPSDYTRTDDGHFIVGPRYPSLDHIVPLRPKSGPPGEHTLANSQVACCLCNSLKSNSTEVAA